jgi:Y-X(10)_GDL-associated radical SAM protein
MTDAAQKTPVRYLAEDDLRRFVPVHVVWEITLACDLKCLHCGSRAGHRRTSELTTGECLEVVRSLAALGTREVSLIGGEAYLRKDWTDIVRAVRSHGMYCAIQTGARNLTPERMRNAVAAGLNGIGVSLDGMASLHDRLRNVPGSFHKAVDTLRRGQDAGLSISVNTQIGAETMEDLPELMETIIEIGVKQWQIQLTVAMGNAVDNDGLLLQPHRLLELMPLLARLYREGVARGLLMIVGNNIGYFGPYEHLWRGFGDELVHWTGCRAGQNVIALEADGTVKGCPSLATVGFAGGNVRHLTLEEIWHNSPEIHFGRLRSVEDLWGFCRTCYYADVCRAGCTWTAHSLLGVPGNNPYCHYRALELDKLGLRERIRKIRDAAKASFAIGEFEIITERVADGAVISTTASEPRPRTDPRPDGSPCEGGTPPRLHLCRSCNGYIKPHEATCPHCGADIRASAAAYDDKRRERAGLIAEIEERLSALSDRAQFR